MLRKTGGNQIHDDELDFHQMKTQSVAVEMFWKDIMMLLGANIVEKCSEKRKSSLKLKNHLMKNKIL